MCACMVRVWLCKNMMLGRLKVLGCVTVDKLNPICLGLREKEEYMCVCVCVCMCIYICVCVCVCGVRMGGRRGGGKKQNGATYNGMIKKCTRGL